MKEWKKRRSRQFHGNHSVNQCSRRSLASRRNYALVAYSRRKSTTAQDPVFPGEKRRATKATKGREL